MADNASDGLKVEETSSFGDQIMAFVMKYVLIEFAICAIIFLLTCLTLVVLQWNKCRRRNHHEEVEDDQLPVSTTAKFTVTSKGAATPTASGAGNDGTTARSHDDEALDRSVLASMPTFVYSSTKELRLDPCAICWKGFKDGEKGRLLRPCFHVFHVECSDVWFRSHSTCRVCGAVVGELDV